MMRCATPVLLATLAACRPADAPPSPAPAASTEAPLDALVPPILEQNRIPGAVIVVGDTEKVTYRKAFGAARLDTVFDLASCTKVVATTTAAMKLVEEGRIQLDDPVGRYLPVFADRDITVRELLAHRSGLPAYLTPKGGTPEEILQEISALKMEKILRYS